MNRTVRDNNIPRPKPVEKIVLSEKNVKWKAAAAVILLILGVSLLVYAFMSWFGGENGWTEIEVSSSAELNCSDDFVFLYHIGSSGISAPAEKKAVTSVYTETAVKAYRLFTNDQIFEDVNNIRYINEHPNEIIEVDTVLYEAFSLADACDSRYLYLAPVYEYYDNLFYSNDDSELASYDPYLNEQIKAYYGEIAVYAGDKESVDLELLGDNKVRLNVSGEYLEFAKEEYIGSFIDFYWMKNAFIIDYLADAMIAAGHTKGSISSFDGFVRNLDQSTNAYAFNIYDRVEQNVYPAAVMHYEGPLSIVYLRNYRMNSLDGRYWYEMRNGEIRTAYVDLADGCAKTALNNLVSYSSELGCASVLLSMIPVYVGDEFAEEELKNWKENGICSIFCRDYAICYNDKDMKLDTFYRDDQISYSAQIIND